MIYVFAETRRAAREFAKKEELPIVESVGNRTFFDGVSFNSADILYILPGVSEQRKRDLWRSLSKAQTYPRVVAIYLGKEE
jgi:hypothetical protein